jgi:Ca2+-transporting ATPase
LLPVFVEGWPLVLLPVQIAFLELIIDPACSIVFEAEPIDPETMHHPPRGVDQPMFDRRVLALAALQGISVLVAVFAVYLWAMLNGRPDDVVRSLTFATLVVGNLALILVNRSWRLSIARALRERRNRALGWILVLAAAVLALLLVVPALREAFNFGPIHPTDVPLIILAGFAGVVWFEVYKALGGGERATAGRTPHHTTGHGAS